MKQIKIADTDLTLAPLGMGCVNAGLKWDGAEADRLFDAFLEMGGNVFDSARVYSDWIPPERGRSERVIGDWLARSGKRDRVVLITKGGHPDMTAEKPDLHKSRVSAAEMEEDLDLSLQALRTDRIDLYFYHRDDRSRSVEELIDTMERFVRKGKIRYYGCSNWSTVRMQEADAYCQRMGYRGFAANQALYNIGCRHMNPMEDDTLETADAEMCAYHQRNPRNLLMPYMGLCSGFFNKLLTDGVDSVRNSPYFTEENRKIADRIAHITEVYQVTVTQAVLGFFAVQGFPCLPLYGPRNASDLKEALDAFAYPFTMEDYR